MKIEDLNSRTNEVQIIGGRTNPAPTFHLKPKNPQPEPPKEKENEQRNNNSNP